MSSKMKVAPKLKPSKSDNSRDSKKNRIGTTETIIQTSMIKTVSDRDANKSSPDQKKKSGVKSDKIDKKDSSPTEKIVEKKEPKTEDNVYRVKVKARQAEISKFIVNKYLGRTEDEDNDNSKSEEAEKDFDNMMSVARSPTAASPPFDSKKLLLMERELSAPRTRMTEKAVSIMFMIQCVLNVKLLFSMPMRILDNGGFYFFIPLAICMLLIGAPMVFLELALGQYTSQISGNIFPRMSPILSGVCMTMLLFRSILTLSLRTEHRFFSMVLEIIGDVFFDNRNVVCTSPQSKSCYIPDACEESEVFYQGDCYDLTVLMENNRLSLESIALLKSRELLHPLLVSTNTLPYPEVARILKLGWFAHKVDAIFFTTLMCFIAARIGVNAMARMSMFIIAGLVCCFLYFTLVFLVHEDWRAQWSVFCSVVNSDISELKNPQTWSNACILALISLSVGDGTLHSLGAMYPFNNNIFYEVLVLVSVIFVSLVFGTLLFGAMTVTAVRIAFREIKHGDLDFSEMKDQLSKIGRERSFIGYQYYFSYGGPHSMISSTIFYVVAVIFQTASYVLLAENVHRAVIRAWPRLRTLDVRLVRHTVFLVVFSFTATVYYVITFWFKTPADLFFEMMYTAVLPIVVVECVVVSYHYKVDRFIVNICTMFSSDISAYRMIIRFRFFLGISWKYIAPPFCFLMFLPAMGEVFNLADIGFTSGCVYFIAFLPIFMAARELGLTRARGLSVQPLLRPTPSWGPAAIRDKRNVNYDERAARILI